MESRSKDVASLFTKIEHEPTARDKFINWAIERIDDDYGYTVTYWDDLIPLLRDWTDAPDNIKASVKERKIYSLYAALQLHIAKHNDTTDAEIILIKKIETSNISNFTRSYLIDAIKLAVQNHSTRRLNILFADAKVSPNVFVDKMPVLHYLVSQDKPDLIAYFIEQGANKNTRFNNTTAFEFAILIGHIDCARIFNIKLEDALCHAISKKDTALVDSFLVINDLPVNTLMLELAAASKNLVALISLISRASSISNTFLDLLATMDSKIPGTIVKVMKSVEINSFAFIQLSKRFGNLPEKVANTLIDRISFDELYDAVITPQGETYNRKSIEAQIKTNGKDPFNKQPLSKEMLIPNIIIKKLNKHFKHPNVDVKLIPPCLISADTKSVFKEPVVGSDGITYEKKSLESYVRSHNNMLPTKIMQNCVPYFNNQVDNLIKEMGYRTEPAAKEECVSNNQATLFAAKIESRQEVQKLPQHGFEI